MTWLNVRAKLRSLLLFLAFEDKYADRHYVITEPQTWQIVLLFYYVPLFFGMVLSWWIVATYGFLALFGYAFLLIYGTLQAGHIYDYYRARR